MKTGSARWWRELGLEPPPGSAVQHDEEPPTQSAAPRSNAQSAMAAPPRPEGGPPATAAAPLTPARRPSPSRAPAGERPGSGDRTGGTARSGSALQPAAVSDPARAAGIAVLSWDDLPGAIEACTACALRQGRKRSVPGVGGPGARWMFVGEGPGAEEDARGEPFVGAAGKLLDAMLAALGLSRGSLACIANVVKCRPPGNRTPEIGECAACMPFLQRQIELVQPAVLVALGRVAAQALLASEMNVGSLRGKVHRYQDIPLIVTYHPAYLLRNQPEKARAWADLCLAQRVLEGQAR